MFKWVKDYQVHFNIFTANSAEGLENEKPYIIVGHEDLPCNSGSI